MGPVQLDHARPGEAGAAAVHARRRAGKDSERASPQAAAHTSWDHLMIGAMTAAAAGSSRTNRTAVSERPCADGVVHAAAKRSSFRNSVSETP